MEKKRSFKKLINQYKELKNLKPGILFNDSLFPPSDKSIFSSKISSKNKKSNKPQIFLKLDPEFSKSQYTSISKEVNYTWKSISSYIQDYNIININVNKVLSPDDIIQGNIADSYFISALKFLSEESERISSLFNINKDINNKSNNFFEVNVYLNGYKNKIIIDDKFPFIITDDNNSKEEKLKLAFCGINNKTNNIWPIILEKVWAKINTSYEDIIEGDVSDVFLCFSPCPIKLYHHDIKYNNLYEKIKIALDNNFIVCADINSKNDNKLLKNLGILSNHAYKIIGCGTILDSSGNMHNLIKIYNEFDITNWIGDWSPYSSKWSDEYKRYLNYEPDKEKNVFYIDINDYLKFYSTTYILYWHKEYNYFCDKINITGINEPFTCCKITFKKVINNENNKKNVTYFIINTKNKRIQNNYKNKENFENIFKNISLFKKEPNNNLILIDSICGKEERIFIQINNELIKQGDEFFLFISFPSLDKIDLIQINKSFSINPKRPNNICVGIYTNICNLNNENDDINNNIKIEPISYDEKLEKYIIKSIYEKSQINSHIYFFDKEKERETSRSINLENEKGAYGYLVIDNRSSGILYEKLIFYNYENVNLIYFTKSFNKNKSLNNFNNSKTISLINDDLVEDKNSREIINCLMKEKYINNFEETKIKLISKEQNNNNIILNNKKEKTPFELLIKLGSKTTLILIFEKCDEYAYINIRSQINFSYPLYMIISHKKNNSLIANRLEYKGKKVEIYENIIEHSCGVMFYYINKEKELNAKINIIFRDIKNLNIELISDQLELDDKYQNNNKAIEIIKDKNNNIIEVEINVNCLKNEFLALKSKNIFENFSYSLENNYTLFY